MSSIVDTPEPSYYAAIFTATHTDDIKGYDEEAEHAALLIISLVLGLVVDAPALLREWYARKGMELPAILDDVTDISTVAGEIAVGV